MYGLVNKSVQAFLRDNYGPAHWGRVARRIGLGPDGFEAMLRYDDELTGMLIREAGLMLDRPRAVLLEDIGAYLATLEPVRRLLRFGGADYREFLISLEELRDRGRMALGDLDLPELILRAQPGGRFEVHVRGRMPGDGAGWGAVVAGLLRAMADDYGALALIEMLPAPAHEGDPERVQVLLLEEDYAAGRDFTLAGPALAPGIPALNHPSLARPAPSRPAEAGFPGSGALG